MQKLDMMRNSVPWEAVPEEMDDAFAGVVMAAKVREWCCRLDMSLEEIYGREDGVDMHGALVEMVGKALKVREGA
jgi:hypothetical protein